MIDQTWMYIGKMLLVMAGCFAFGFFGTMAYDLLMGV